MPIISSLGKARLFLPTQILLFIGLGIPDEIDLRSIDPATGIVFFLKHKTKNRNQTSTKEKRKQGPASFSILLTGGVFRFL